jgi:Flp pilus assembly protein TadB
MADLDLTPLIFALLAAGFMGGISLLVWALIPREVPERERPDAALRLVRSAGWRLPLTIGVVVLTLALTRWPVAAVAAGVLALFGPSLFGGTREHRAAVGRLAGVAVWTESLRDTIAGAVGLEQAIMASAVAPPPAIAVHVRSLADRLRVRVPLPVALQMFADDLDDPGADLVVAALLLNARLRGPGLRQVLSSLADSTRAELDMRDRVESGRASTRRGVRIVVIVTLVFVLGLRLLNPEYVEPYGTPVGQIVLLVVIGLFAGGFWWLRRLSAFDLPQRFLVTSGRFPQ